MFSVLLYHRYNKTDPEIFAIGREYLHCSLTPPAAI
jgi:hypothetical protein